MTEVMNEHPANGWSCRPDYPCARSELDRASDYLAARGYQLDWRAPCANIPLDTTLADNVVGTIVFGAAYCMSEIPRLPFLQSELRWLDTCINAEIPVLGICQGAQMIAHLLGADVGPGQRECYEFGYYRVSPTESGAAFLPTPLFMLQAHYHEFQLPSGATHLASGELFSNQAFSWGEHVYGLQFHPEVTLPGLAWLQTQAWWQESSMRLCAQRPSEQLRLGQLHDDAMDQWFRGFLDKLFCARPT